MTRYKTATISIRNPAGALPLPRERSRTIFHGITLPPADSFQVTWQLEQSGGIEEAWMPSHGKPPGSPTSGVYPKPKFIAVIIQASARAKLFRGVLHSSRSHAAPRGLALGLILALAPRFTRFYSKSRAMWPTARFSSARVLECSRRVINAVFV